MSDNLCHDALFGVASEGNTEETGEEGPGIEAENRNLMPSRLSKSKRKRYEARRRAVNAYKFTLSSQEDCDAGKVLTQPRLFNNALNALVTGECREDNTRDEKQPTSMEVNEKQTKTKERARPVGMKERRRVKRERANMSTVLCRLSDVDEEEPLKRARLKMQTSLTQLMTEYREEALPLGHETENASAEKNEGMTIGAGERGEGSGALVIPEEPRFERRSPARKRRRPARQSTIDELFNFKK